MEVDSVIDPCFVCNFPTEADNRVEVGNPAAPTLFHKPCKSAAKYLDQQADRQDKMASKHAGEKVTTAQQALKLLKERNKAQWSRLVLHLVVKEQERRGPEHQDLAVNLIEQASSFAESYKQDGV
eukprot:4375421-Pyramimonas_sp.AAC.1